MNGTTLHESNLILHTTPPPQLPTTIIHRNDWRAGSDSLGTFYDEADHRYLVISILKQNDTTETIEQYLRQIGKFHKHTKLTIIVVSHHFL